uniref:HMA domain-containing protein n=1 Tax=Davidia involucrata TaxID=16924 RepID=A0A5B7C100_DAVIN
MESTLSATTLFAISKTLNSNSSPFISRLHRHVSTTPSHCLRSQLACLQLRRIFSTEFRRSTALSSISYSSNSLRSLRAVPVPTSVSRRLECVASSAASFASGAGGGGGAIGGSGGDGDGDGSSGGWEAESKTVAGGSEEVSAISSDVIIIDVGGMTCGGCAASVKRILESQPQVSSASVNLTTETAIVWPVSEAKVAPNWKEHLGETLAKHLTSCGFKSNIRGQGATEGDIPS